MRLGLVHQGGVQATSESKRLKILMNEWNNLSINHLTSIHPTNLLPSVHSSVPLAFCSSFYSTIISPIHPSLPVYPSTSLPPFPPSSIPPTIHHHTITLSTPSLLLSSLSPSLLHPFFPPSISCFTNYFAINQPLYLNDS